MSLFRSEEALDNWCAAYGYPRGAIISLEQMWALSKLWYSPRMQLDFHGWTLDDALRMFAEVGLTSDFWKA